MPPKFHIGQRVLYDGAPVKVIDINPRFMGFDGYVVEDSNGEAWAVEEKDLQEITDANSNPTRTE